MNKTTIYALSAIFLVLIAIGITGISKMNADGRQEVVATAPAKADSGETGAAPGPAAFTADGLMNVVMPGDVISQVKDYAGFRVSFNADNKTPNWVAWELLGSETSGPAERSNKFWTDGDIKGSPSTSDYSRSGYDRGHMCPAADQKWSAEAMNDCFVMTNMCPQDHALNSGAWNTLENKERNWAARDSAILIVSGPIYTKADTKRIGSAGVRVPGAFFKVFAAPYLENPRGIAFVYPNMSSPGNMENYVMTIDEVEKITGFDFFAALPDEIENKIESESSFKDWNRR